jgi:hypothetical protein
MTCGWPRMMKLATAAAYCDLSVDTFKRLNPPKAVPLRPGGVERYDRKVLDAWLDKLSGVKADRAATVSAWGDIAV